MENPNPSKDSTSTNNNSPQHPPSGDVDDVPKETNQTTPEEDEESLKTALEVLVEFRVGENENVEAYGSMVMESGEGSCQALKKRRNNAVKDHPSEYPICPTCKQVFPTWGATIDHMQKHHICDPKGDAQRKQIKMEVGPSNANVAPESAGKPKCYGFDLNELPPKEEEDDA